jgi:hypothetical protein
MSLVSSVAALAAAALIAFSLNKILGGRIEKREWELCLRVVTYIVCFPLSVVFIIMGNLRMALNGFIDARMAYYRTGA